MQEPTVALQFIHLVTRNAVQLHAVDCTRGHTTVQGARGDPVCWQLQPGWPSSPAPSRLLVAVATETDELLCRRLTCGVLVASWQSFLSFSNQEIDLVTPYSPER
jgi:hypothetical protein